MKKIIVSSIAAAVLATSGLAEEGGSSKSGFYMGVGYNSMSGEHTRPYTVNITDSNYVDYSSEDKIDDLDADGSTIKIGWDKKNYRFEISYSSLKAKGTGIFLDSWEAYSGGPTNVTKKSKSFDEKITGFDFDLIKPFTDNSLKPYLAAGLGIYTWNDFTYGASTIDRKGVSYNLGAGVLYSLGNIELDIAYKWKKINWEDVDYIPSSMTYTDELRDEETTLSGLYAGINYHF